MNNELRRVIHTSNSPIFILFSWIFPSISRFPNFLHFLLSLPLTSSYELIWDWLSTIMTKSWHSHATKPLVQLQSDLQSAPVSMLTWPLPDALLHSAIVCQAPWSEGIFWCVQCMQWKCYPLYNSVCTLWKLDNYCVFCIDFWFPLVNVPLFSCAFVSSGWI